MASNDNHTDDRHTDDRHTDDRHTDDRHTDDRHTDDRHTDDGHADDGQTDQPGTEAEGMVPHVSLADPPAEDTPTQDGPADDGPVQDAAPEAAGPAKARRARKGTTRTRSTGDADADADAAMTGAKIPRKRRARAVAVDADEGNTGEASNAEASNTEASNTEASNTEASNTEDSEAQEPVTPTFGLLFQAPEPTAGRRRRSATAPATHVAQQSTDDDSEDGAEATDPGRASGSVDEAGDAPGDEPAEDGDTQKRRRRRGGKGRRVRVPDDAGPSEGDDPSGAESEGSAGSEAEPEGEESATRRRRRRRRTGGAGEGEDSPGVVTRVREPRRERDEVVGVRGSTRLEAKKQRRREGREAGRRRTVITEAEFLARRESVERVMVVREKDERTQIGVLEDGVLVEHYISRETNVSMAGNIYLGRVQNVLPSMEAAFVDIGKGRNAVLYAGEVNWDAAGLENNAPKRIENALSSGENVLVQVTKDPIGHKGARLTSQISLPGRYLVYVPNSSMTGISRKLPDNERARLKRILKDIVPDTSGVIVRTAAEGASEEELRADVERLTATWEEIQAKAESKSKGRGKGSGSAPVLLHGEPDLTVRVIRDIFNEDFTSLVVAGDRSWDEVSTYVESVAPDLFARVSRWTGPDDLFTHYRVDEQLAKAMDRKVWLPSGGSLVIDRTEAMTVVDVNTGKFVGSGGNLEETVTKNNIEAAEEIVRQLRLRDIGGIIVIDFIDMVLESNRDLVVRRLLECLGRDRTKHQVAEVTSLGLVQMTRKRVGSGLIEVFSEMCETCNGRGIIVHADPVDRPTGNGTTNGNGGARPSPAPSGGPSTRGQRTRRGRSQAPEQAPVIPNPSGPTPAQIAAAAHAAALKSSSVPPTDEAPAELDLVPDEAAAEPEPAVVESTEVEPAETEVVDAGLTDGEHSETEPTEDGHSEAEPTDGGHSEAEPTDVPAQPEPRSGRRRRGRVMAPAGPPRTVQDQWLTS